jgi:hypothetical protein
MNTITLGGLPIYEDEEIVGLNRFIMRTGGSRYGRGWFLMRRSDYDTLAQASANGVTQLVMKGDPGPGLSVNVVVAGAEPISTAAGSDQQKDVVKVTVYDQRCQNFSPIHKAYNVWQTGFPLDGSNNPTCYTSTLNGGSPWSWAAALTDAEIIRTTPANVPSWHPYNLIWLNVPAARAIDDVAARLFYVVAFNHQGTSSVISSLNLLQPGEQVASNGTLYQQAFAMGVVVGGGPALRNLTRLPTNIAVTFPAQQSGSDPYAGGHFYYAKTVASGINGASGGIIALPVGEVPAIWSGSAWSNQTLLDAIAADLAPRFGTFISQPFTQIELVGIWPFTPDGMYRQVEWISDKDGARTILKSDNAKDWLPTDQLNDPLMGVSPQEVVSLGGGLASIGSGGTKYVNTSGSLPTGGQHYQVLEIIDTIGTWGIDWPRFH